MSRPWLDRPCPTCNAESGKACRTLTTGRTTDTHIARLQGPKVTGPCFAMTYNRIKGFRTTSGEIHRGALHLWGPGPACVEEPLPGRVEDVPIRRISCGSCLDSLPGIWEVQVPDKRFSEGCRTLYTGFTQESGARSAAEQSGRKDATVINITMRELLEMEGRP